MKNTSCILLFGLLLSFLCQSSSPNIATRYFTKAEGSDHINEHYLFQLTRTINGPHNSHVLAAAIAGGKAIMNKKKPTTSNNSATPYNAINTVVKRDKFGNFSANTIFSNVVGNLVGTVVGNVLGNASTATTAVNLSGPIAGDVIGTQTATQVKQVGGIAAPIIAAGANIANSATNDNVANTVVKRNAAGDFVTHMISITGKTTRATDIATKSYVDSSIATAALSIGLSPKQSATVASTTNVALSRLQTIDNVTLAENDRVLLLGQSNPIENGLWLASAGRWSRPTDFTTGNAAEQAYVLVLYGDTNAGSGWLCNTPTASIDTDIINFAEFFIPGTKTAQNVGTSPGQLFKDKTGIFLNFKTIGNGDSYVTIANNTNDIAIATNATASNATGTLVARDTSGNFVANTITANLVGNVTGSLFGNATTATTTANFMGSLSGDVIGNQTGTTVATVGGIAAVKIAAGAIAANAATATNNTGTIVARDASGNFNAGTISANVIGNVTGSLFGNATTATTSTTSTNFTGSLSGDVIGTQSATTVATVGGVSAANIAAGATAVNTATASNVANSFVKRDASGNFSANTISANVIGNVTGNVVGNISGNADTATTSINFTGSLSGDVTGNQTGTVVATVGGVSAASIAAGTTAINMATASNTANTIIKRDASGNFVATTITANLIGNVTGSASNNMLKAGDTMTGKLILPTGSSSNLSLQLGSNTGTGLFVTSSNALSLNASGATQLTVNSANIQALSTLILANLLCNQAAQSVVPTNNSTVTANATTSILILKNTSNVANVTIVFPASPTDGQLFTILLGSTNTATITNNGNGATVINGITSLNPTSWSAVSGGTLVTYYYTASSNSWLRFNRG